MSAEDNDPVAIPDPDLPPDWQDGDVGKAEESVWVGYDEIVEAKKANKLAIHKAFKWIIPAAIILAFLGFVLLLGAYLIHLIIPADRRWLTAAELQHIHNMIFSSVVGGALAIFAKTYFIDAPKD